MMTGKSSRKRRKPRRAYSDELKAEAVQMLLDGHSAQSVARNLGLSGPNLLYRWKEQLLRQSGPATTSLENRVRQLEEELRRVERERDIFKKALAIFPRGADFTATYTAGSAAEILQSIQVYDHRPSGTQRGERTKYLPETSRLRRLAGRLPVTAIVPASP